MSSSLDAFFFFYEIIIFLSLVSVQFWKNEADVLVLVLRVDVETANPDNSSFVLVFFWARSLKIWARPAMLAEHFTRLEIFRRFRK